MAEREKALTDAILDIDAHATGMGEDADGFVTGGYIVTVGALHRALGVVGHTAVKCRYCDPSQHDCATVLGTVETLARLRRTLTECRDWFDNPDGGEPDSNDLLRRINEALR